MADFEHNETAHNHTILHIKEMMVVAEGRPTPTTAPRDLTAWDTDQEEDLAWGGGGGGRSPELMPTEPIVLYLWREHTAAGRKVLKVLPSLNALKHNQVCRIVAGNDQGLFQMSDNRDMSSLQYTTKLERKAVHELTLTCHPIHNWVKGTGSGVTLPTIDMTLQLHVL